MINDNLLSVTGGDLITYLNGSEGTATSINQAWMDYLTREGYTTGTLNDRLYNKLRDDGFTGTLADMLTGFWSTPQTNYVARLDGATQYWQLSGAGISLSVGDIVTFKYKTYGSGYSPEGQISSFFDTETQRVRFRASNSVQANISGGVLDIDGVIYNSNDQLPDGSLVHFASFAVNESTLLEVIGGSWLGGTLMPLPIFEFSVSRGGTVINEIPLTNKAQGATQLATVGNVNATMVNYTEAVWEEV